MVRIEDLAFRYPGSTRQAIDGLSLHVRQGLLYGLLGPNGSGKTTLISLLMGLRKPDRGRITLTLDDGSHPRTAFVPQEYAFYERLAVRENLHFFAGVNDLAPSRKRAAIDEAVTATALGEHLGVRASELSGGLKRRLNLAIGLAQQPRLLVLDEPTVGIDPHSRHFILESIRAIHRAGTTIIYTSHYMEEVQAMCEEIGVLDHGRLIAGGALRELLGRDRQGALYVDLDGPIDADWLAGLPHARMHEGRLQLSPCSPTQVGELLDELRRRHIAFSGVRYAQQTLEDLFLQLTGRQLRD